MSHIGSTNRGLYENPSEKGEKRDIKNRGHCLRQESLGKEDEM
jgi:hypothetical protein